MDDKQKIRIHKLIKEIAKKKKQINTKAIEDYVSLKEAEKVETLPTGEKLDIANVKKYAFATNTINDSNEKEIEEILKKQNELLDDILSSESTRRITSYVIIGILIIVGIGIMNWVFSPSSHKEKVTHTHTPVEIVSNSPWDGSVYQVENYLKKTLKDPDSYQSIEWWKVKKISNGYKVLHKYRAKNSFGGYVVQTTEFILDSKGNVISATNYK